jgi:hypothetical protein
MRALSLALTLALLSCPATVMDPAIVRDLAALQPSVDDFLAQLQQKAGTAEADYELHAAFYQTTHQDLASLRSRADAADVRALSLIDQVSSNIDGLEKVHREGFNGAEIPALRQIFAAQFEAIRIAGKER